MSSRNHRTAASSVSTRWTPKGYETPYDAGKETRNSLGKLRVCFGGHEIAPKGSVVRVTYRTNANEKRKNQYIWCSHIYDDSSGTGSGTSTSSKKWEWSVSKRGDKLLCFLQFPKIRRAFPADKEFKYQIFAFGAITVEGTPESEFESWKVNTSGPFRFKNGTKSEEMKEIARQIPLLIVELVEHLVSQRNYGNSEQLRKEMDIRFRDSEVWHCWSLPDNKNIDSAWDDVRTVLRGRCTKKKNHKDQDGNSHDGDYLHVNDIPSLLLSVRNYLAHPPSREEGDAVGSELIKFTRTILDIPTEKGDSPSERCFNMLTGLVNQLREDYKLPKFPLERREVKKVGDKLGLVEKDSEKAQDFLCRSCEIPEITTEQAERFCKKEDGPPPEYMPVVKTVLKGHEEKSLRDLHHTIQSLFVGGKQELNCVAANFKKKAGDENFRLLNICLAVLEGLRTDSNGNGVAKRILNSDKKCHESDTLIRLRNFVSHTDGKPLNVQCKILLLLVVDMCKDPQAILPISEVAEWLRKQKLDRME